MHINLVFKTLFFNIIDEILHDFEVKSSNGALCQTLYNTHLHLGSQHTFLSICMSTQFSKLLSFKIGKILSSTWLWNQILKGALCRNPVSSPHQSHNKCISTWFCISYFSIYVSISRGGGGVFPPLMELLKPITHLERNPPTLSILEIWEHLIRWTMNKHAFSNWACEHQYWYN